jgi:hypothetical protein
MNSIKGGRRMKKNLLRTTRMMKNLEKIGEMKN